MNDFSDETSLRKSPKRVCKTCRWWSMHSLALKAGDCMVPGNHRYSRVPIVSKRPDGSEYHSYALFDSFGPETTPPGYTCGAWDDGALPSARKDGSSLQNPKT